jgi:hypothetical protein
MSYTCAACGNGVESPDRRKCGCSAPLLATMTATVYGKGTACRSHPFVEFFRAVGRRVLARGV